MRVLFDAFWWLHGPTSNRQVEREIVTAWTREFPEDDVVLAVRSGDFDEIHRNWGPSAELVKTHLAPHALSNIFELPLLARKSSVDISVCHNFSPLFGRSAVFVHDVLFQSNPEWFTKKERLYFTLMPMFFGRADVLLTSSKAEVDRILSHNRKVKRVTAVGLAVGTEFTQNVAEEPEELGLSAGSFVLTVGRLNVRKNLGKAVSGAVASGAISISRPLVVVGEKSGKLRDMPEFGPWLAQGLVIMPGFVSEPELVWLYQNCSLFLFMTLGEGFGLPPLEAMHFGRPMIVSDIPVMREVTRDSAVFADPRSESDISEAISMHFATQTSVSGRVANEDAYSWSKTVAAIRLEATRVVQD